MTARYLLSADAAQPGDLVYVDRHTYVWPSKTQTIPLAMTSQHANPLAYWRPAIADALENDPHIDSIQLVLPFSAVRQIVDVDVPCAYVVCFCAHRDTYFRFVFETSDHGALASYLLSELELAKRPQTVLEVYADMKRPVSQIKLATPIGERPGWTYLAPCWSTYSDTDFRGQTRFARDQLRKLKELGISAQLSPPDRRLDSAWVDNATFRWPYAHWMLARIVLALSPLNLPTYVMLWIANFLSPLHVWKQYPKITLIEGLVASIRAVKQRRSK